MRRRRVAIAGYALEAYAAETVHSSEDLGFLVAQRAREMAGIERDAITSVHNSTMDLFDGVTISNGILQPAAGGYGRDGTRIQNGGLFAVISACASILCGASDVAVVSSVDAVRTDRLTVSNFSSHPLFGHSLGFNSINSCALFASAYLASRDVPDGDSARIAAKNYAAGAQNRYAHIRRALSADEVAAAPIVSSPLRESEISLISSYGGSALVLVSEERADRIPADPLWITGFGMSTNPVDFQKQEDLPAMRRASQKAYQAAGIEHPRAEIALSEINALSRSTNGPHTRHSVSVKTRILMSSWKAGQRLTMESFPSIRREELSAQMRPTPGDSFDFPRRARHSRTEGTSPR